MESGGWCLQHLSPSPTVHRWRLPMSFFLHHRPCLGDLLRYKPTCGMKQGGLLHTVQFRKCICVHQSKCVILATLGDVLAVVLGVQLDQLLAREQ